MLLIRLTKIPTVPIFSECNIRHNFPQKKTYLIFFSIFFCCDLAPFTLCLKAVFKEQKFDVENLMATIL